MTNNKNRKKLMNLLPLLSNSTKIGIATKNKRKGKILLNQKEGTTEFETAGKKEIRQENSVNKSGKNNGDV